MREIKFRAWDIKNKFMERPQSWLLITQIGSVYMSGPMLTPRPAPIDQYILMQFTGLKDKNGKEIYEGDIIIAQDDYGNFPQEYNEEKGKYFNVGEYEVYWDEHSAGFSLRANRQTPELDEGFYWEILTVEIIGNIYENPELLK